MFGALKIKMYNAIILPVVLCGCETWSVTLREECRLRIFENSILRRILRPKRDVEWRRLHLQCVPITEYSQGD